MNVTYKFNILRICMGIIIMSLSFNHWEWTDLPIEAQAFAPLVFLIGGLLVLAFSVDYTIGD